MKSRKCLGVMDITWPPLFTILALQLYRDWCTNTMAFTTASLQILRKSYFYNKCKRGIFVSIYLSIHLSLYVTLSVHRFNRLVCLLICPAFHLPVIRRHTRARTDHWEIIWSPPGDGIQVHLDGKLLANLVQSTVRPITKPVKDTS